MAERTNRRFWKLTLEYDGSSYSGWQDQTNARTVMGEIKVAAQKVCGSPVELAGAGRTDAGVHASGQVAVLRVKGGPTDPEQLTRLLNEKLPATIAVLSAEPATAKFHPRHDAVSRSYVYQIATRKSAFSKKYTWWLRESLDVEAMQRAAKTIEGRHDFSCFRAEDPWKPNDSPIVVVTHASIEQDEGGLTCRFEASHFVWRMVRRLVGALVKVGLGEITEDDFASLLLAKCSPKLDVAAWTAPSAGLFLEKVTYPEGS